MAVPAHDDRDFEFAKKFDLPIIQVVEPPDPEEAELVRQRRTVLHRRRQRRSTAARSTACRRRSSKRRSRPGSPSSGQGKKAINYKLRDWLFSRQRYWGEPFPILHTEDGRIIGLSEERAAAAAAGGRGLPAAGDGRVAAGEGDRLGQRHAAGRHARPSGKRTRCRSGRAVAGTICATSTRGTPQQGWDPAKEQYWMPVDLYIGGAEHAVLHLLYSRFWHKFLYDLGYVRTKEPFQKLINQGMILGEDGQKMSKSRGNVVNPDEVIDGVRRRLDAALRDVHGPAGGDEALEHAGRRGRVSVPPEGLAGGRERGDGRARRGRSRRPSRTRRRCGCCTRRFARSAATSKRSASTPRSAR